MNYAGMWCVTVEPPSESEETKCQNYAGVRCVTVEPPSES